MGGVEAGELGLEQGRKLVCVRVCVCVAVYKRNEFPHDGMQNIESDHGGWVGAWQNIMP